MKVLVITQVFPNVVLPHSAPFNRKQLAALGERCEVEVLAPVPWLPGARLAGKRTAAGRLAAVPARDERDGLRVEHPRVVYVPGVPALAGALYVASLARRVLRGGRPDVVLGTWAYPDGFAAVVLARALGVPAVVKLHGSDLHVNTRARLPRLQTGWGLGHADRVVAVSGPLAAEAEHLGAAHERVRIVPNGVDLRTFQPRAAADARRALGLDAGRRYVTYVGRLEPPKGVGELLTAFETVAAAEPDLDLLLVGEGSLRADAEALSARVGGRVHLAGSRPHDEVALYMAAADVVTLPSWSEGTPNVVLEALASGRPVVASRVGGVPDVVTDARLGELVPARDPAALAAALVRVARGGPRAEEILRVAAPIDWATSARRLEAVLREACGIIE